MIAYAPHHILPILSVEGEQSWKTLVGQVYKNYVFIARMIILFVLPHYRNRWYGNVYYDKTFRYEFFW